MNGASVYARTGSGNWYVSYWCPKRLKRVHEATAWRISEPTGKKHAYAFAAAKAHAASAFRGTAKLEVWNVWVEKFLSDRYRASPKTYSRVVNAWDHIRVFLAERELKLPAAVDYNHVLQYVDWRVAQKRHCGKLISRNTTLTEVKVWGIIMREAIRRGFATVNPCSQLGLKRDAPAQKPEMTDAEIATIRASLAAREGHLPLPERWMTVCFEIAIHQGCRLSETQVPLAAIGERTIQFTAKGRNGRPNIFTTTLHPGLAPLIAQLRAAKAERTCTLPRMASKDWHDFLHGELGLGHLCFHCTRVTVITRLARAGVPIQQAMRFVGHASEAVHQIYQRLKAEDLSACVAALGSLAASPDRTGGSPQTPDGHSATF